MTSKSASELPEMVIVLLGSSENMGVLNAPALDNLTTIPVIVAPMRYEHKPERPLSELIHTPEVQRAIMDSFQPYPFRDCRNSKRTMQ